MGEWKRPPPKFTRKRKNTTKVAIVYLIFIVISILIIAVVFSAIKWMGLNPIFGFIVFIISFVSLGIGGFVIHLILIKEMIDSSNK